jgi:hypothetical protein
MGPKNRFRNERILDERGRTRAILSVYPGSRLRMKRLHNQLPIATAMAVPMIPMGRLCRMISSSRSRNRCFS